MRLKANHGFTLVELIVVVAIVGVMASALLIVVDPFTQIKKARDARVKSDLSQIQKGLETYYEDKGSYPATCGSFQIQSASCIGWGNSWTPYMNVLPKDPSPGHNYVYSQVSGGQGYYLYANLNRGGKDPQACHSDGSKCNNVPAGASCGSGATCNFGASSPNVSP